MKYLKTWLTQKDIPYEQTEDEITFTIQKSNDTQYNIRLEGMIPFYYIDELLSYDKFSLETRHYDVLITEENQVIREEINLNREDNTFSFRREDDLTKGIRKTQLIAHTDKLWNAYYAGTIEDYFKVIQTIDIADSNTLLSMCDGLHSGHHLFAITTINPDAIVPKCYHYKRTG